MFFDTDNVDKLNCVRNYNEEKMLESFFPASEMIDRLSEENLAEFTLDKWMAIYKQAVEKKRLKEEYVLRVEE